MMSRFPPDQDRVKRMGGVPGGRKSISRFARDWDPIAERYASQRGWRNTFARHHDSNQIQWIGGRDRDRYSVARLFAGCPQRIDGDGKRKLFSWKSGDEAASTNFAAVFEASVRE